MAHEQVTQFSIDTAVRVFSSSYLVIHILCKGASTKFQHSISVSDSGRHSACVCNVDGAKQHRPQGHSPVGQGWAVAIGCIRRPYFNYKVDIFPSEVRSEDH